MDGEQPQQMVAVSITDDFILFENINKIGFPKKIKIEIFARDFLKIDEVHPFEEFWNLYDKKVGMKQCQAKWKKINKGTRIEIMKHLQRYIPSKPDRQYRMNPLTYINGQHWNDEIIGEVKTDEVKPFTISSKKVED